MTITHGVGDNVRQVFRHGAVSNDWYIVEAVVTLPRGQSGYVVSSQKNRDAVSWLWANETEGVESMLLII